MPRQGYKTGMPANPDSDYNVNKSSETELTPELEMRLLALSEEIRLLRELLARLRLDQYVRALLSSRHIIWVGLLSGIANGLGAVIGATLVLALLVYLLSHLEVVPVIGRFISELVKAVQRPTVP